MNNNICCSLLLCLVLVLLAHQFCIVHLSVLAVIIHNWFNSVPNYLFSQLGFNKYISSTCADSKLDKMLLLFCYLFCCCQWLDCFAHVGKRRNHGSLKAGLHLKFPESTILRRLRFILNLHICLIIFMQFLIKNVNVNVLNQHLLSTN